MALTKNGKLIGAASASQKRDIREEVLAVSGPNSDYWKARLRRVFKQIIENPAWAEVWDSDMVPQHTTYMEHALLAEQIIGGRLTLPKKKKITRRSNSPGDGGGRR